MLRTLMLAGLLVAIGSGATHAAVLGTAGQGCPVTIRTATVPPNAGFGAAAFNYGNARLRAALYWPKGTLTAGTLPEGGSMATIEDDGSIRTKVGWWRKRGKLVITGRRLDSPAPPLRSSVPAGYGESGFQPTGLLFPSFGCWQVTGSAGGAHLTFVVKVRKHERSIVRFGRFQVAVSNTWYWRLIRAPSAKALQISNASFRVPGGGDPIKEAQNGTFVLTLVPLGNNGSPTTPTINRSDFLTLNDPTRPRGRAVANHSYCTTAGPCLAISLVYKGNRVPALVLAAVNKTLNSLHTIATR